MEFYIWKKYEEEKNNNEDIELGFNRFSKKTREKIIILFTIMIIASIAIIISTLISLNYKFQIFCIVISIASILALASIDKKHLRENIDSYVGSHLKKIDILHNILEGFSVDNKEKIDILISKYKNYIDEKNREEEKRNKLIFTIFSGFAGVLSVSFINLDNIEIEFINWLYLASFILIIVGLIGFGIYSYRFFDTLKNKYKDMILDLEDIKINKY